MNKNFERIQFITAATDNYSHAEAAQKACEAGVRWIQYRNKKTATKGVWEEVHRVKAICKTYKSMLIINDDPHLAFESDADGVHLGKDDVSVDEARNLIGKRFIIGVSCHDIDNIMQAQFDGADYVGLGPFRLSTTKNNLNPLLGKAGFEKIMNAYVRNKLSIPVYAIGGVNENDIEFFLSLGIYGVAVSSVLFGADDMAAKVRLMQEKFQLANSNDGEEG